LLECKSLLPRAGLVSWTESRTTISKGWVTRSITLARRAGYEQPPRPVDDDLITSREIALVLGISANLVTDWELRGRFPARLSSKPATYRRDEVARWASARIKDDCWLPGPQKYRKRRKPE